MSNPTTALELLLSEPHRFQLGPAIRLLGRAAGTDDPLAGGDRDAARVRVCHRLAPTIALHEVDHLEVTADGTFRLTTPVLNVIGVTGVMPAEVWRATPPEKLDRFHRLTHRLVAAWYAEWIATPRSSHRLAAALARPASAAGLEAVLAAAFTVRVRVREGCGGWAATAGPGGRLSVAYDPVRWCELHFGPVDRTTFDALMPGGSLLRGVFELARRYAGPVPRFRVAVTLREQDAQAARRGHSRYDRGAVAERATEDVVVWLRDEELRAVEGAGHFTEQSGDDEWTRRRV